MRLFHQSVIVASLLACLTLVLHPTPARAATGPGTSGGGSVTGITVLPPLVLSGTQVQLPQRISQLNTNQALTNASTRDFYQSGGNLYSKNLSLNHRWVHYDDFNQPMTTPGVFPDAPTGARYNVFTGGGGNTNKINLVDGKWWLGETGAVYKSVTFGTNGVYGSAAPINAWGGTFSYQRSTNNTPDGYEQNLFFILSPQVDFLPTNYLHITIGANIFRVQRELSATNIIYAQHFGGRYLAFDTNHSFTVTIISNNIICDIAGMRYVGYDESLSTTYGNIKVATWEAIGSPTNQFWGKWDSEYFGYAQNAEHWQYAGPFAVRSNGVLSRVTSTNFTLSVDDAYASGWNGSLDVPSKNAVYDAVVNYSSNNVRVAAGSGVTVASAGSGGVQTFTVTATGGSSTQMVAAAIGALTVTNSMTIVGATDPGGLDLTATNGNIFTFTVNKDMAVQTTNVLPATLPTAGQIMQVHSIANGVVTWTNVTPSSSSQPRRHFGNVSGINLTTTAKVIAPIAPTIFSVLDANADGMSMVVSRTGGTITNFFARVTTSDGTAIGGSTNAVSMLFYTNGVSTGFGATLSDGTQKTTNSLATSVYLPPDATLRIRVVNSVALVGGATSVINYSWDLIE